MDISLIGRNAEITNRFRDHVEEKSSKIEQMADRALVLEVRLCRHHQTNERSGDDRVELTLVGPGPVIRAEAGAGDKYAAFDMAFAKLLERVRRDRDRRKIHRGQHRPQSVRSVDHADFRVADVQPAEAETLRALDPATGAVETVPDAAPALAAVDENQPEGYEGYNPVVIRRKVFSSQPMTVDDALYYMELVGHDFYLFLDAETGRPSVVYRRKGWDYGVIGLDEHASEVQEVATAARALRR
jgi:ribosomal subunit interface protein